MVCKKCGNEIKIEDEICKKCGAKIDPESYKKKTFSLKIPKTEFEKENLENVSLSMEASEDTKKTDVSEEAVEASEINETDGFCVSDGKSEVDFEKAPEYESFITTSPDKKIETKPAKPTARKISEKEAKKIKSSYTALKAICCVCAVVIIALSCVSIFTDYLKTDTTATKTVALSRLSENDKASFEEYISKFSPLYGKEMKFKQMGIYDFLDLLDPSSPNGLYSTYFKKAQVITGKVDPAVRFGVSEEECSYCKVKADDVKSIASSLGVKLINAANNANCYYLSKDGCYYYAAKDSDNKASAVTVEVTDSKRTENGSYYIECEVKGEEIQKIYCLANMKKTDGITSWQLVEISAQALFAEDGTQIQKDSQGSIPYEMKNTKITARTSGGVTFAKYEISYPVFDETNGTEEENKTAATLNLLYGDLIKAYREKANDADKSYKEYKKKGYVESLLPGTINIVSTVMYDKNGYISLLDETTEYSPTEISKQAKRAVKQAEKEGIEKNIKDEVVIPLFPTSTYSGYTINIQTSEFVKKDEFFGKEYRPFQEKLFKIYMGRDADAEIDITDDDGIGRTIYSSVWVLSENGVGFCYPNPLNFNEIVVLPYKYLDKNF